MVQNTKMVLIADIGGTNARFSLVEAGEIRPQLERTLPCADYGSLVDAVLAYLDDISQPMPDTASIAIATPVSDDRIRMTNHVWEFSVKETAKALGLRSLRVLNDFTALALALPHLKSNEYRQVGGGAAIEKQTMAVLGPGTGLGVSGAIYSQQGWLPLQGEGGHVAYGPLTDREEQVIRRIHETHSFIEAETLVSGPGLLLLYQSIARCDGAKPALSTPEQVVSSALNKSDAVAEESLAMFCSILGTIASNLALTLGARGGVYIGGGIVPKLGAYFDNSMFRSRFETTGRYNTYLSKIPTCVISAKYPALTGAAVALAPQYDYLGISSVA